MIIFKRRFSKTSKIFLSKLVVVVFFSTFGSSDAQYGNLTTEETQIENCSKNKGSYQCLLEKVLSYDDMHMIRPQFEGPATNNTCNIYIQGFDSMNAATMDYSILIFLHQRWTDSRLKHNYKKAIVFKTSDVIERVWKPDLYIDNEKEGAYHRVTTDNMAVTIMPSGEVFYSMRLSLKLFCHLKLHSFPMDRHNCSMVILSYAYNANELILKWRTKDPLVLSNDLEESHGEILPQFALIEFFTKEYVENYGSDEWSFLEVNFLLERQMGFYILTTFIPSILLVAISWISFWLHPDATPARTSLMITTILTITTQSSWARGSLPEISYVTAIDVWMSTCICFACAAFLEFACVNYIYRLGKERCEKEKVSRNSTSSQSVSSYPTDRKDLEATAEKILRHRKNFEDLPRNIDKMSRILFPLAFGSFNVVYWCYYSI